MPHAVFSSQVLPRDVQSEPQPDHDRIPSTREETKRLLAGLRAAARAAVAEWRRLGVSPTQKMMRDVDVYPEEVSELLDSHLRAEEALSASLERSGVLVPVSRSHDSAERVCYHAIRTCKGLAVSPINLQRLLARAMPGHAYTARDFITFAIGMRAVSSSSPEVRRFLSVGSESLTASDMRPMVNMLRNIAHVSSGRVRVGADGAVMSEVTTGDISRFGMESFGAAQEAMTTLLAAAGKADRGVSLFSDTGGSVALPVTVGAELVANDLTYQEWRENGWGFTTNPGALPGVALIEPMLVAMRRDGVTDDVIVALRPEVVQESGDYPYSPQNFLSGAGFYAIGGYSDRGGSNFGPDHYVAEGEFVKRLHRERNLTYVKEWTSLV